MRLVLLVLALLFVAGDARSQPRSRPAVSGPAALRALVDSAHAAGGFDGAVMVFDGRHTASATAGDANRAARTPWTLATRAPWCSITKLATASLVLQRMGEGRLRLDDDARTWAAPLRTGPRVSLRQMLAHTSGLARDADVPDLFERPAVRAAMDSVLAGPRRDAPGASWRYNNLDYIALERVVAATDGGSYAGALRRRVLRPLGLRSVRMGQGNQTVGYAVDSAGAATPVVLGSRVLADFGAAGGLVGDVRDLLRLGQALASGRLLPPALRDTLTAPVPRAQSALSVWVYTVAGPDGTPVRVIERQGWIAGNRALLLVVPETNAVVAVLANTDAADLDRTYTGRGFSAGLLRLALRR